MQQIIQLISPETSDEEKFAGFYLIPKSIDPNDLNSIQILFEKMPWNFLKRCIGQQMSSKDQNAQDLLYLGIHIWDSFAQYPSLLETREMLSLVEWLKDAIYPQNPLLEILLNDLYKLTSFEGGLKTLNRCGIMISVSSIHSNDASLQKMVLTLLESFIPHYQPIQSDDPILMHLSKAFDYYQNEFKFQYASLLALAVSKSLKTLDRISLGHIQSGLIDILTSKISIQQRDVAMDLTDSVLSRARNDFLIPPTLGSSTSESGTSTGKSTGKSKTLTESKWTSLLIQIVGTELRVLIEENDLNRAHRVIPIYTHLYEGLLECMADIQHPDPDIILPLRSKIQSTFSDISSFLLQQFEVYSNNKEKSILDNPMVLFTFKCYTSWFIEESVPSEEICAIVPLLTTLLTWDKNCLNLPIIEFFNEFLQFLVEEEEEAKQAFIECDGIDILFKLYQLSDSRSRELILEKLKCFHLTSSQLNSLGSV